MRIYPDPELPDISVEWIDQDCRIGNETVSLVLDGLDSMSHVEITTPCTDIKKVFKDVEREQFRITGQLRDANGTVLSEATQDADLRDGLDEDTFMYFGGFDDFRVAWRFDNGATCASLGARQVQIGFGDQFAFSFPCEFGAGTANVPSGQYTVTLTAYNATEPVAQSAPQDVMIDSMQLINLGTVTLSPLP